MEIAANAKAREAWFEEFLELPEKNTHFGNKILRKIYEISLDELGARDDLLRIVDESGED